MMIKFWINTTCQVVVLKGDEVGEGEEVEEEEEEEEEEVCKIMLMFIIFKIHLELAMLLVNIQEV